MFMVSVDGIMTRCRIFVHESPEVLFKRRCQFIADHQQYHGKIERLQGAYLAYDNEAEHCVYTPNNDLNGGRERFGMGILMSEYLHHVGAGNFEKLERSLHEYREFVVRELGDADTGEEYNDVGRDNSYHRLENLPVAMDVLLEQYQPTAC